MKLRTTTGLACLLPFAVTLACGAPNESDESFDDFSAEVAVDEESDVQEDVEETDVVASADVGYGTVYFHERTNDDGTMVTGVSELAPGNYVTTPLTQMMAEGHTTLEVFVALLPDAEPPASFVDTHAAQAQALGRESNDLQPGVFDANAPIEKSVTWCRNIATPASIGEYDYTYSSRMSRDDTLGSQQLTLNAGTKATAPAICNENASGKTSSHTVQGRVRMKKNGGSYDSPGWTPQLAPGWAWQWHGLALWEWPSCGGPPGTICLPVAVDASYNLQGKSNTTNANNTYDLYIAKIDSVTFTGVIR